MSKLDETLNLEDAFSDDDESPTKYLNFSEIVRKDMANIATAQPPPQWPSQEQNSSVSTLDMDSGVRPRPSLNLDDGDDQPELLSAKFVQVSLSTTGLDAEHPFSPGEEEEEYHYPQVLIDASQPPERRVTLSSDYHIPDTRRSSGSESSIPSSSPPRSAQSLPTPTPKPEYQTDGNGAIPVASASSSHEDSLPPVVVPNSAPPQKGHRPQRSVGPSALERFRSKTRPTYLPPKNRQEDDKHLADWQTMMKHSRAAAEKRRKALQERRTAREKKIEESLSIWQQEIVPDWRVVQKNPELRKLWWKGIPSKLRASMWQSAVGNPLALSKDNYRTCLARAKRTINSGTFSAHTMQLIEEDIAGTLPSLHIFHHETGPLYSDLKDMLCAWFISRTDEGLSYKPGAARIAAMLLINMPVQQAFVVMRNLLERHCLRSFYGGDGAKMDVEGYYRIFDTLLADGMPKIYFNFKQHQISPGAYLPDWLIPLFLDHLPFEACARVWDVIILEGDSFVYRAALGMLAVLEPRLFFPEKKELMELLRGENKAALDVAKREGRPLDGGRYEIYGVDEETLWERIDSMDEWWKASTWNRLIQRELPDL